MVLVSVAAVFGCSLVLLLTNSSLVGDGSYYVLQAIQTGKPFRLNGRQGINLVREGPLLLAVDQGVTNTHVLTVLEGIGFLLFPALVWILAIVSARGSRVRFTLVLVSCGLCYATMIFFSVSELTLAFLLSCWSRAPHATHFVVRPQAALAMVATLLLCFSHEALVPCAILLGLTAVIRIRARLGPPTPEPASSYWSSRLPLWARHCHSRALAESQLRYLFELPQSTVLLCLGASVSWLGGALQKALWTLEPSLGSARASGPIQRGWDPFRDQRRPPCGLLDAVEPPSHWLGYCSSCSWPTGHPTQRLDPLSGRSNCRRERRRGHSVSRRPPCRSYRVRPTLVDRRRRFWSHNHPTSWRDPCGGTTPSSGSSYLWLWTNTTLSLLLRSSSSNAVVENTALRTVPFSAAVADFEIATTYRWNS